MKLIHRVVLIIGLFSAVSLHSCLDHDYDVPPEQTFQIPFQPNISIAELKARYVVDQFLDITEELYIHGTVVADDKSGNFFKKLVIQDSTGGIEIQLNRTSLYTAYPVGMKVGLSCKGLTLGAYNELVQIGKGTFLDNSNRLALSRIEDALIDIHLFKGPLNQPITPKKITIGLLANKDLSTLIELEHVEFIRTDTGKTYADLVLNLSRNLIITDCNDQEIILRSTNFATFAGIKVPSGNGSLVGIFSRFGSDLQVFIRDTYDVKFLDPSCNGSSNAELITIKEIRNSFAGTNTKVSDDKKIKGIVISDRVNANIHSQNLVIQDATAGITVRFTADHAFNLGDEIEINVGEQELSEFDGLLQVNKVPVNNALKTGIGSIAPKLVTLAQIVSDFENLESSLVQVSNVTITKSSGATFSGTCQINDGTSTTDLFTRTQALFASTAFPTNAVTMTGVVSQGGTSKAKQISLRSTADIGGGTNPSNLLDSLKLSFDGLGDNVDLSLSGWVNKATVGTRVWRSRMFSGNFYAQATAFNDTNTEMETWLITPTFKSDVAKLLSFESAYQVWKHDGLRVFVSTNFDGNNIAAATWTPITARLATQSDAENAFIPSGNIDLTSITMNFRVAFVYNGNKSTNTTSYRVDNIYLRNK
ncbi:MAG: DUF5689 domain-containing protein [Bacteroidota bacterium]|nr:DUF5689 domain-containing protein [Bacteroidota bacterium]